MKKIYLFSFCCLFSFIISGCSSILTATTEGELNLSPGSRTFGTVINDTQLATVAKVNINKAHPNLKNAHINVTSFNNVSLLTGQVLSPRLRELAGETVTRISKVRQVYNELQVQAPISLLAKANDSWLSTKIKTKFLADANLESQRIKVISENGTVFLMGLLTHQEAEQAAQIARQTVGVQKVVKAIEYIDD